MSEKQRLLVVEDEATLRETVMYNLKREGYEVVTSGDGGEALEIAREQKFDLIVLDVMLPTLDGLSICRILRKEQRTPIILLTARSGEVDRIMGLETGADDYIVKPFSLGEFLARVRAVLRRATPEVNAKLEAGRSVARLDRAESLSGGRRTAFEPQRVRFARGVDQEHGHGPQPRSAVARGVGLRFSRRYAHRGCARPLAAREDRR